MKQQFKRLSHTAEFRSKLRLVVRDLQRSIGITG